MNLAACAVKISPCRLLFLDEAARLDARSIATLFELCERLQMQLIIAAPENISPEKGTTYKLVRKVFQNTEHVHVVGLRGFAPQLLKRFQEVTKRLLRRVKIKAAAMPPFSENSVSALKSGTLRRAFL